MYVYVQCVWTEAVRRLGCVFNYLARARALRVRAALPERRSGGRPGGGGGGGEGLNLEESGEGKPNIIE